MIVFAADLKVLPLAVFGVVLAITLGVTYWAAKRTSSASDFYAAGRGITGFQNGWAIAGDYMSASSFLGFAGLTFLFGVDAFVGLMAAFQSRAFNDPGALWHVRVGELILDHGFVTTDPTADLGDDVLDAVPARRAGTPEEVAACVRFLASEDAAYVTGTTLTVDGGMTA